jgi:hypothetical protein
VRSPRQRDEPELAADGDPTNPNKRATIHFFGEINNYWDRPYDGTWNFALDGGETSARRSAVASRRRSAATT